MKQGHPPNYNIYQKPQEWHYPKLSSTMKWNGNGTPQNNWKDRTPADKKQLYYEGSRLTKLEHRRLNTKEKGTGRTTLNASKNLTRFGIFNFVIK